MKKRLIIILVLAAMGVALMLIGHDVRMDYIIQGEETLREAWKASLNGLWYWYLYGGGIAAFLVAYVLTFKWGRK